MSSLFTRIIRGEIPSWKIAENEQFFAFLDAFPLVEGHVLVVPKTEVDRIWDVPDDYLHTWFAFAKPIAAAIEKAFPCNRCAIVVLGMEVPHAHMHLLPANSAADADFTRPKMKVTPEDQQRTQEKILAALAF